MRVSDREAVTEAVAVAVAIRGYIPHHTQLPLLLGTPPHTTAISHECPPLPDPNP